MKQPNAFEQWLHGLTAWRNWQHPPAEDVVVPRDRRAAPAVTGTVQWGSMVEQRITVGRMEVVGFDGRGAGTPMQNGRAATTQITWGYREYGQRYTANLPLPAEGDYWTGGAPHPMFDRHAIVVAPDGSVHELIQFSPGTPTGWWWPTNAALGWGRWRDGVLVEGKPVTATGLPMHRHVLTTRSVADGHALAIVVADYLGADGLLEQGPVAGELLVLDPTSVSYRRMVDLGGVCKAVAEMAARHGVRVIDRNGYVDTGARVLGKTPRPPSLLVHAGAQWAGTNLHQLDIPLIDLRRTSKAFAP